MYAASTALASDVRVNLRSGFRTIELVDRDQFVEFRNADEAFRFLSAFMKDPGAQSALAATQGSVPLLPSTQHLDKDRVLRELARRVAAGQVRILAGDRVGFPPLAARRKPEPEPSQPEEWPATQPSAIESEPPPPEEETMLDETDAEAQAEVLETASESGSPFCEE